MIGHILRRECHHKNTNGAGSAGDSAGRFSKRFASRVVPVSRRGFRSRRHAGPSTREIPGFSARYSLLKGKNRRRDTDVQSTVSVGTPRRPLVEPLKRQEARATHRPRTRDRLRLSVSTALRCENGSCLRSSGRLWGGSSRSARTRERRLSSRPTHSFDT